MSSFNSRACCFSSGRWYFSSLFSCWKFSCWGWGRQWKRTGRLLLLCMPFRSAAHAAIGLFVFAFDAPKFFGALDAGSTSRACVRKVGCWQRRPKNSILHAKLFPTRASVVDLSGSNWSSNRFLAKRAWVHINLFWWWTLLYFCWDCNLICSFFFARHGLARAFFSMFCDRFPCLA